MGMSFKENIINDIDIFMNSEEFAEEGTYNGQPITLIPEIGEQPGKGNFYTNEGLAEIAYFWVKVSDVKKPKANDAIVHDGLTWRVARIVETSDGMHLIEATRKEAVGWSR